MGNLVLLLYSLMCPDEEEYGSIEPLKIIEVFTKAKSKIVKV